MAKTNSGLDPEMEELRKNLPEDVKKVLDVDDIETVEDLFLSIISKGYDPVKIVENAGKNDSLENFNPSDYAIEEGSDLDTVRRMLLGEDIDEDEEDEDWDDELDDDEEENKGLRDESYMLGLTLPKRKFIGPMKKEFHIRIKLNNAPVNIWRELVVPSNITLEMLAYVLIEAMGWAHEHLYHYIAKNNVCYLNSRELKERNNSFFAFLSRVEYKNSEKTTLENVLQPRGGRIKFEYDYGDSWTHDLWVKETRDYDKDEKPVIKLLKAHGMCPPEDCGGVWGYAELLELNKKKRKTAEDKERLDWFDISKDYDPEDCDLEWLQEDVEDLWTRIKEEL